MKELTVDALYTLEETIAKDIFAGVEYPWEVLPKIHDFILELGSTLPEEEYEKVGEDVWIARSANVFPSAYIHGPAIIGMAIGTVMSSSMRVFLSRVRKAPFCSPTKPL